MLHNLLSSSGASSIAISTSGVNLMPFVQESISLFIKLAMIIRCYSVIRKLKSFLFSCKVVWS